MGVDEMDRAPEKSCIHRGPHSGQRHGADRSWKNQLVHELSGLRVAPAEHPRWKIGAGQNNVEIIYAEADVIGRKDQAGGRRECVLGDLYSNLVVATLS